ncbi:MAG: adenosylcobinamide-GDP ribazoletransferase [Candidatus Omnitrophota bacterium]
MKSLLAAAQFLTVIPIRIKRMTGKDLAGAAAFFPVVGLLLGMVLAAASLLLTAVQFGTFTSSVIIVVLLVLLTGGMHLDGLSDTCDALFSGKERAGMLNIMRDPHAGVMGVLALISVVMLKVAFISAIGTAKETALVLMCVLGRSSMVVSLYAFPYARVEGKARAFIDGKKKSIAAAAMLSALAVVFLIAGTAGTVLLGMTVLFAYMAGALIKRKIGGITGDTIGAVSEITEVAVLFGIAILERTVLWIG